MNKIKYKFITYSLILVVIITLTIVLTTGFFVEIGKDFSNPNFSSMLLRNILKAFITFFIIIAALNAIAFGKRRVKKDLYNYSKKGDFGCRISTYLMIVFAYLAHSHRLLLNMTVKFSVNYHQLETLIDRSMWVGLVAALITIILLYSISIPTKKEINEIQRSKKQLL